MQKQIEDWFGDNSYDLIKTCNVYDDRWRVDCYVFTQRDFGKDRIIEDSYFISIIDGVIKDLTLKG